MSDQPQPGSGAEPHGPAGGAPPPSYPQGPPPSYPPQGYPPQGPPGGYAGYGYGPAPSPTQAYTGFWPRVGGWLIDFILIDIVSSIVGIPLRNANVARLHFTFDSTVNNQTTVHHVHFSLLAAAVQLLIVLLYTGLMIGSARGQTLGMMAVNARAVDAVNGSPIGFWRAVGRTAFEYLMLVLAFFPWVLDMLFPAWDARHQTLHDKVTNTVVIRTNAVPEQIWSARPGGWGPPG